MCTVDICCCAGIQTVTVQCVLLVFYRNVRPDDQILCSGEAVGASAMRNEEDIGTAVNHSYIVSVCSLTAVLWPLVFFH